MSRILIAGMGNLLRSDDGFGVEVARQLATRETLPPGTRVIEVGIGGIHLVHELMAGFDALIVVDAMERGSPPGTAHVLEAEVADLDTWSETARQDFLADVHYATPTRALILAKALNVLPPTVYIVGCQPFDAVNLGIGLSREVTEAVATVVARIERLAQLLAGATPTGKGAGDA